MHGSGVRWHDFWKGADPFPNLKFFFSNFYRPDILKNEIDIKLYD